MLSIEFYSYYLGSKSDTKFLTSISKRWTLQKIKGAGFISSPLPRYPLRGYFHRGFAPLAVGKVMLCLPVTPWGEADSFPQTP